jgi:hypothetical protein
MSEMHDEFSTFHEKVALTSSKKASLRQSRDAIRTRIRDYFTDELKLKCPRFHAQGSYSMVTTVVPIDGEFDLDDGVYLQHLDENDQSDWPTAETVHGWLVEATKDHTHTEPVDKPTCVRVVYKGSYHLDLPSYAKYEGEYLLAVKGTAQWKASDPKALTDWFKGRVKDQGEQLRRMVRYLKAWDNYQAGIRGELANGVILTVLAERGFCPCPDQDDAAFARLAGYINNEIRYYFSLNNPVDSSEDLANRLSDARRARVQEAFADLSKAADQARAAGSRAKASEIWREQFGSRFPLITEEEEKEQARKDAAALSSFYVQRNPPQPWAMVP